MRGSEWCGKIVLELLRRGPSSARSAFGPADASGWAPDLHGRQAEERNRKFHRQERSYGKFVRCFDLPDDADEKQIAADFKDGVLRLSAIPGKERGTA
jgi:hypothetical protein